MQCNRDNNNKTKLDQIGPRDEVGSGGQGMGLQDPRGSTGRFDGYFDDLEGLYISDSDYLEGIPAYL